MSEHRYFQSNITRTIYQDTSAVAGPEWFARNPDFTEVQVVPVDAIVIRREELPEVKAHSSIPNSVEAGDAFLRFDGLNDPREHAESRLRDWAAIAAHLREHPPVDEAQVKAVTQALYEATEDPFDIDVPDVARRLVERGVRVGEGA
ncbi:hypothetical protein [Puerhibacterium puerhi]|uniref:hypothetical protein n=1 Tax=Puerhibacterium puerhi TaxID=2692623 RepID=UPI0013583FDA|nr:hypothetical protein [Puerhibacterium puerhi]